MTHQDLLIELQTEELPPKALAKLSQHLTQSLVTGLEKQHLKHGKVHSYAAPRRLAVCIQDLQSQQEKQVIERKGPAVKAAFDQQGKPTPACLGFAKSCQTTVDQLERRATDKGEWLFFNSQQPGAKAADLIPTLLEQAIATLPIPKRMRWGTGDVSFARPVHHLIVLLGHDIVPCSLLGLKSGRQTEGHRFLGKGTLTLQNPQDYATQLENNGYVIASFAERRAMILKKSEALLTTKLGATAQLFIDEALLDEVTALVEWPIPLLVPYDERFLALPREVLLAVMHDHQKYFAVTDQAGDLLPYCITVSNLESQAPEKVIHGNQRVMQARLEDAEFFFQQDQKHSLESWSQRLTQVTFEKQLGSLADKTQRLSTLATALATVTSANAELCQTAAALAKADLMTGMVGEFPELQGTMGYYYARLENKPESLAHALRDYYKPRYAGEALSDNPVAITLGLADRLDTLVGIFGIGKKPTGDKDPYALRRTALGIIRLIIEKQLSFNLLAMLEQAQTLYSSQLSEKTTAALVFQFIRDRMRVWCHEQGLPNDCFDAVAQTNPVDLYDFYLRINAVKHFKDLTAADALAQANKRVTNILKKQDHKAGAVNSHLFEIDEEQTLHQALAKQETLITPLLANKDYAATLQSLAQLQPTVDAFFDKVMVMAEDPALRNNRIALLHQLRTLFLKVADIALLQ